MTPDFILHRVGKPPLALPKVKEAFARMFANVTNYRATAEQIIVQGDRVAVRWTIQFNDKKSGKQITIASISMDRIVDGRMAEAWEILAEAGWDD